MDEKELRRLARAAQAKYQREWRAKNKEKVKEHNRTYWERKALKMAQEEAEHGFE